MSKVRRLPALIVLPLLLIAGLVVQAGHDDPAGSDVRVGELTATAAAPGTPSSTWYCAAGSAKGVASGEGAGPAEQRVMVANASDTDLSGTLTVFLETGPPTAVPVTVPAHSRVGTLVSDVVKADWAAVLVEITGGEVTVAHELTGPDGRSVSDSASTPSADWYFPGGTTVPGTDMYLALFNPFPGEATVDVAFGTDSGARTPPTFQGIVVPGGSVVVQRIGFEAEVVPGEAHLSTTVSVRSGRIVAEQVQSYQGRQGEEGAPTVRGLPATIGATAPAPVWAFPTGSPKGVDGTESVAVFNPGDTDTTVLVQVQIDDPEVNGSVEPFEISVAAHRSTVVDVSADSRVPEGVPYWLIVRSTDGADVVAQRSLTGNGGAGIAYSIGLPVAATRWLTPVAVATGNPTSLLMIANPSATDTATVTVRRQAGGTAADLDGAVGLTLAPGERTQIDLVGSGFSAESSVEVDSDTPVVVGQWMSFASTPADIATPIGIPVAGTQSVLVDPVSPSVLGDEPVDDPSLTLPPDPTATDDTAATDATSVDTTAAADGTASSTTTTAAPAASSTTTTTAPGG